MAGRVLTACLSLNSLCALGLSQTLQTFFFACLSASPYTHDEQVAASKQTTVQKFWEGRGPRRNIKAVMMLHAAEKSSLPQVVAIQR